MKKIARGAARCISVLLLSLGWSCGQAEETKSPAPEEASAPGPAPESSLIEAPVRCFANDDRYVILGANGLGCVDYVSDCHGISRVYGRFSESAGELIISPEGGGEEMRFETGTDGNLKCLNCDGCNDGEMVYRKLNQTPLIPNDVGKLPWITGRVIAPSGMAMRSGPSPSANKVGSLKVDEIIEITDTEGPLDTIEGYEAKWVKARSTSAQGWVFSGFLESGACACRNFSDKVIVEYAFAIFFEASFAGPGFRTEFRIEKKDWPGAESDRDCFKHIQRNLENEVWECLSLSPASDYYLSVKGLSVDSIKIDDGSEVIWSGTCKSPSPYKLQWEGETLTFFTIEDTLEGDGDPSTQILQLEELEFNKGSIRKTGNSMQLPAMAY